MKPPPGAQRRRTNAVILAVAAAALALIVLVVIVGALAGGDDGDQAAAATSSTTAAARPPIGSATPRPAPGPTPSDPRCAAAAANVIATVEAGLSTAGYALTNATVIAEGGLTYVAATIVDGSGTRKSRSDVWVLRDGVPYSATGGARRESTFARADEIGVGPGDEPVQAVENCVVNATR